MNAQLQLEQVQADGRLLRQQTQGALSLSRRRGELKVLSGRVWLTRRGELGDQVLEAGQTVQLAAHDQAVVEAWGRSQGATLRWRPLSTAQAVQALLRAVAARALWAFAGAAGRLARSAAASARRAQGCICPGDSIASSGALK